MHAKVTAYNGFLVLELLAQASISDEVTTSLDNPGNFGQVIHDTAKHLGVSPEALALLKTVSRGQDSLGDVDWFRTSDEKASFGWLGGPFSIKSPLEAEGSRNFELLGHVVIPSEYSRD